MNLWGTILEAVFPSKCFACGAAGEELCTRCISHLESAERESAKWIFPLFDYRDPILQKGIKLLKYRGKKRIAGIFAEIMYGSIVEELSELGELENFREPVLIPIPLSPSRMRERGYNQSELIARKLHEIDGGKSFGFAKNILIKIKDSEHQARIESRALRLKNIVGSFAVGDKEMIKGRDIILIDDVLTTGATLSEARKTLKEAGARKIIAFTVAH